MKIAIIAPEFLPALGGVGIYTFNLVRELIKDTSLEIHVITPKRKTTFIPKEFRNVKIHFISEAKDKFFYNLYFQLAVANKLQNLNKKYRFDMIHSAGLVHMPDIFVDYDNIKVPNLVTVHTTIDTQFDYDLSILEFMSKSSPVELLSKLTYPYIKLMQNRYVKNTQNFICVSRYASSFLPKNKNIEIIHNGIDTEEFKPGSTEEFGYLDKIKQPKILYSGRLLYMKGIGTLIDAANALGNNAHFIIAGDGNRQKWMHNIKYQKSFTFLGQVDHAKMNQLYKKCDIFVLPSYSESFPISLLEAMSSGLTVVASNVGGIPEMIDDKKNGYLFERGNSLELASLINELISNPRKRKLIGINARKAVLAKYSSIEMAKKTKEVYCKITGDKNRR